MLRFGCLVAMGLAALGAVGQSLRVEKVDPPNWYAGLPKPMLLVSGEGLRGATISLSDKTLRVERVVASENGHWAQVWLSGSPAKAETVTVRVVRGSENVEVPYTFAARRAANDGLAGFSDRDMMYLIMTDRFADGDATNDGPLAKDAADSGEAKTQRGNPHGWHGGDLRGIEQHLDYLQGLGVTAVWPTPVYQNHSPEAYHGYHATDYYAVDEHYGSMSDLQSLTRALHARGMKLLLDTVPNHVGPLHPWVKDSPTPDWFHGTAAKHIAGETHFDALVNPHAPERDRVTTLEGWFVDQLPDMNTENPAVAQYLRQNAVWWMEQTGADGIRIDTFPYVDRAFWHEYLGELRALYPHMTEVGEVSGADPEITSAFADGVTRAGVDTRLYTPFDFPFYYAAQDVFVKGESFARVARVLAQDQLYLYPERLVPFLGNHDQPRFAEEVRDPELRKIAFALVMTTRGTPQVYAGDEIAMQGKDDPDNRRDFPGGFPGDGKNAFLREGRTPEQEDLHTWVAALGNLRLTHPALACGSEEVLQAGQDSFVYDRSATASCKDDTAHMLVVLQRGALKEMKIDLHATALQGCVPGSPLLGRGRAEVHGDVLTIFPETGAVIVPCATSK